MHTAKSTPINPSPSHKRFDWKTLLLISLLLAIICSGAYFRTIGVDWDQGRHLHPDERFLSMVLNSMTPVPDVRTYFDTSTSTLNPGNVGYQFFVYGTLPLFIIRYVGEWIGQTGYDPITIVGRQLSAIADILTILLVFLIALRLFDEKIGLMAAALYAFAVLPIQQSHFMTVDTFTNTFGMLTVYFAVVILTRPKQSLRDEAGQRLKLKVSDWVPYIAFGVGLGMATASKINAAALALLLPAVELVRYFSLEHEQREDYRGFSWHMVLLAAVVSLFVFRLGQPYAFQGPGLLGVRFNQEWIAGLRTLQQQSTGNVDFPPALQWTRRSLTFPYYNLVVWGLGITLGVTALVSLIGMGWAVIKGKQFKLLPLWGWTVFYLLWQTTAWVKAMRYLLLIYPLLAIIAAWGIFQLWRAKGELKLWRFKISPKALHITGAAAGIVVIIGTALWAFAFTRIYTQPHTRVAATDWIYANIPGPVNLVMTTDEGETTLQQPYRSGDYLTGAQAYPFVFEAELTGVLTRFSIPTYGQISGSELLDRFTVIIVPADGLRMPLDLPTLADNAACKLNSSSTASLDFSFPTAIPLEEGEKYLIMLRQSDAQSQVFISGVPQVVLKDEEGQTFAQMLPKLVETVTPAHSYTMDMSVLEAGEITAIDMPYVLELNQSNEQKILRVTLTPSAESDLTPVSGTAQGTFTDLGDGKGTALHIELDQPLRITTPQLVRFDLEMIAGNGQIAIASVAPVHESSWDDALPVAKAGYVPYSDAGGIFRGDLNLELYWPDDASKLERFISILQQGDYIFISSNRQWGTTTRVPERYPLTTQYYRSLLGCPDEMDVVTCYNVAEPGMFTGSLGFELIQTFTSYPRLGPWLFNDQFAEEAFSVYDHPKVLIFKKTADFDLRKVLDILGAVDLSHVVNLAPRQLDSYDRSLEKSNYLMLTEEQKQIQRANGTWSELFDRESLVNSNQALAVIVFYLFTFILGLAVYPFIRLALPGLEDKGYAFSRLLGLLLFGYFAFVLGSAGVFVTRKLLLGIFVAIMLAGLVLGFLKRKDLVRELAQNWKRYLIIELVGLAAFLFFLWVRYQNPDLWHPFKGGEKPMDFSYLNAVIKSTVFPPYDPWFAGGYINYYYFGFVILGLPIKLLGIIPSVAYNIVLPLWYALLVMGAYSVGWNLTRRIIAAKQGTDSPKLQKLFGQPFWAGLWTAVLLAFLGNLGNLKLLTDTLASMGAAGALMEGASVFQKIGWFFKGFGMVLQDIPMPLYPGDWYWMASRTIPGEAITEFPYFTFLYADLHAHLIAMPFVVFSVAWGMSFLFARGKWSQNRRDNWVGFILSLLLGGLLIGALKPINTWDSYTFLLLNLFIIGYTGWRYMEPAKFVKNPKFGKAITIAGLMLVLVVLSSVFYISFNRNFHPGYSQLGFWTGDRTPLNSYFTHWGLLLFIVLFWYLWETYQWLAVTPLSALKKLEPHRRLLTVSGIVLLALLIILLLLKVSVAIVVLPLCLWSLILILKPDESDAKRLAFFMIATALLETLVVELVYLVGDIGRMNVVFKLYMQAWLLLTLALGTGLVALWNDQHKWTVRTQLIFQIPLILLVASTLLFPLMGTTDKIHDRIDVNAPKTLDGMQYMQTSSYYDMGAVIPFGEDYAAIRWMQDNIQGSPVIVEGQAYEYRWGNRYTIYTGLPGVVGWNYHQRQQRAILQTNEVQNRVDAVDKFYMTDDLDYVHSFLNKYEVSYIVVGRLEQAFYPGGGLGKFAAQEGILWDEVYRNGETVIYQVRLP